MTPTSSFPFYTALHQAPPAVLKTNLTKDDISQMKGSINQLMAGTEQIQTAMQTTSLNVQSTLAANGYNRWVSIGSGITTFSAFVIHTVVNWDDNSLDNNLVQVGIMLGTVFTAGHAAIVYYQRQKHLRQAAAIQAKQSQLSTTLDSLSFLRESTTMAKRCATAATNIQLSFPIFLSYMSGLPAGTVPNPLAAAWTETGKLIAAANTEGGQNQLSAYIEAMVLPNIHHYTLVTKIQLKDLGYEAPLEESDSDQPEGELQQVVVE